jgi:hypothetical protein
MFVTETYRVIKNSVSYLPLEPLPTFQITMNVTAVNAPPTPIPQLQLLRVAEQTGTGSEIERSGPPPSRYGLVNLKPSKFDVFKTKLKDNLCTVYFDYQSEVVSGDDPIKLFQPIYVY